jgi:hypothetical protein
MTARCLICGRFYREPGPEETACAGHVYDWNRLTDSERRMRISDRIYKRVPPPAVGADTARQAQETR